MKGLKLAFRSLAQAPFVTLVAIISLALGIGANTAIYSFLDQTLLQALPVQEPEQLVNFSSPGPRYGSTSCGRAGDCNSVFSYAMFKDLQRADSGLTGIAAHKPFGANLAADGKTVNGTGLLVSGSYFPLLGLRPALGRLLGAADEAGIGESFVAVLSYGYWRNRLGGDPDVLNREIIVNGHGMTVVGVAPRGFTGTTLGVHPDVFVPISMRTVMNPYFDGFENRHSYWAYLFGRLQPGVLQEQAAARINTTYSSILNEVEAPLQKGMSEPTLERFRARQLELAPGWRGQSTLHSELRTPLLLQFVITGSVLLIACANIANLLLARGAARAQEMAIRGSLGASRVQLLRQLLGESGLLAVLGGVASLLVARWTLALMPAILPEEASQVVSFSLRPSMLAFSAVLAIATGFVFGLYPALQATRTDLVATLRATASQPSGALAAARFRSALAIAQLALSLALLVAAGLFIKSLINVGHVDLGLNPHSVVSFGISPELNGYEPERSRALFERAEEALAALPGATGVAASLVPILAGNSWGNSVAVEGFEFAPDVDNNSRFNAVSAGYFRTLGIPLLAGREFTREDALGSPKVAIVNEAFAAKFGLDPRHTVGKRMSPNGGNAELDTEIIGLVRNAKYNDVKQQIPPLFFLPYRQQQSVGYVTFYVRAAEDPEPVLRAVPAAIARLDGNLPVEDLKTLEQQVRDNIYLDRMISAVSAAFAILATLLAALGLYGVIAYTVAQRTREIGVRMALGADAGSVRTMVLRQVGRMTAIGSVIGLGAALLLGRAASSLLFGLGGNDPLVVGGVTVLLVLIALAAGYLPARRASRVDPMQALRFE